MQLLFHLVYYHSTCFGHGSCPSSGVIHKTVKAAKKKKKHRQFGKNNNYGISCGLRQIIVLVDKEIITKVCKSNNLFQKHTNYE